MDGAFGAATFEEEKEFVLKKLKSLAGAKGRASKRHIVREIFSEFQASASFELRNDFEVIFALVGAPLTADSGSALRLASGRLRANREVVIQAVKNQGQGIQHASQELRGDKEVVLLAMESSYWAFIHASAELRRDREVALVALKKQVEEPREVDGQRTDSLLRFVHQDLWADPEIVLLGVRYSGAALRFASDHLKQDKDFVLLAARSTHCSSSAAACYEEADSKLKAELSWEDFERVAMCRLAHSGEPCPVLSVVVSQDLSTEANSSRSKLKPDLTFNSGGEPDPNNSGCISNSGSNSAPGSKSCCQCFRCEVTLLSGTSFTILLPKEEGNLDEDAARVTVGQLCQEVVHRLPELGEAQACARCFLVIGNNDTDSLWMTPWDCARTLAEFV